MAAAAGAPAAVVGVAAAPAALAPVPAPAPAAAARMLPQHACRSEGNAITATTAAASRAITAVASWRFGRDRADGVSSARAGDLGKDAVHAFTGAPDLARRVCVPTFRPDESSVDWLADVAG